MERTRKLRIGDQVFTRQDYINYGKSLNLTDMEARQLTNLAFGHDRKKLRNWRSRQVIGKAVAHKRLRN